MPDEQMVWITIADEATGIPKEYRSRIFEPFFTTTKDVGTGLGLWVARQIFEKHGGSMRVRSSVDLRRGSTFAVYLPLKESAVPNTAFAVPV